MKKFLFIVFIVLFSLYVLFSRRPDFFDGTKTTATIHFVQDSSSSKLQPRAFYSLDNKIYSFNPQYLFRSFNENKKVNIIYEASMPEKAAIYSWWGYWITWKELITFIVGYFVLFQAALAITNNPSPEAIEELRNYKKQPKVKKRRYK